MLLPIIKYLFIYPYIINNNNILNNNTNKIKAGSEGHNEMARSLGVARGGMARFIFLLMPCGLVSSLWRVFLFTIAPSSPVNVPLFLSSPLHFSSLGGRRGGSGSSPALANGGASLGALGRGLRIGSMSAILSSPSCHGNKLKAKNTQFVLESARLVPCFKPRGHSFAIYIYIPPPSLYPPLRSFGYAVYIQSVPRLKISLRLVIKISFWPVLI